MRLWFDILFTKQSPVHSFSCFQLRERRANSVKRPSFMFSHTLCNFYRDVLFFFSKNTTIFFSTEYIGFLIKFSTDENHSQKTLPRCDGCLVWVTAVSWERVTGHGIETHRFPFFLVVKDYWAATDSCDKTN